MRCPSLFREDTSLWLGYYTKSHKEFSKVHKELVKFSIYYNLRRYVLQH